MSLAPIIISIVIGYYAVSGLRKGSRNLTLKDFFLMPGLGLGISAQIVFFSLFLFGGANPTAIIILNCFCLIALFYNSHRYTQGWCALSLRDIGIILIFILIASSLFWLMAGHHPYGQWDAWSYWNYTANFLFRSGADWQRVFEFNIQSQHPVLLPCMIVWGWSFAGHENALLPLLVSLIFTVSTVAFLVAALIEYTQWPIAVMGGISLMTVPLFLWHGTSQYADILSAYYILVSSVLILDVLHDKDNRHALITGIFLGLTACSKDNGLVAAALLYILIWIKIRQTLFRYSGWRNLTWAFVITSVFVMCNKIINISHVNNTYIVDIQGILNPERWQIIFKHLGQSLINTNGGLLWPIAAGVFFVFHKYISNNVVSVLFRFVIFFIIIYLFVYAASHLDLQWFLSVSLDRLLFLLVPVVVFLTFYTLGKNK